MQTTALGPMYAPKDIPSRYPISLPKIRKMLAAKEIGFYRVGRHLRIAAADMDQWFLRHRVEAARSTREGAA